MISLIHDEPGKHNVFPTIFICVTIQEIINKILSKRMRKQSKNTDLRNKWLTRVLSIINSKRASNIFFELITMTAQKNSIFT